MSPRELDDETKHIATFDPAVAHVDRTRRYRARRTDRALPPAGPGAAGAALRCAFAALGAGVGCSSDSRLLRGGTTPPRPGRAETLNLSATRAPADTRRSLAKSRTNRTCPATTHDPRRVRRLRTTMQIMRPWMHAAQITNRTTSRPRTQSPASRVPPRVAYAACSLGRGVHHVPLSPGRCTFEHGASREQLPDGQLPDWPVATCREGRALQSARSAAIASAMSFMRATGPAASRRFASESCAVASLSRLLSTATACWT